MAPHHRDSYSNLDRRQLLLGLGGFLSGVACSNAASVQAGPDPRPSPSPSPKSNDNETKTPAADVGLVSDEIEAYVREHTVAESEVMAAIAEETRRTTQWWIMMIGPVEAALLRLLVRLSGAKRVVEVGTFTGYSAIAMAEGLPRGGKVITLDISKEWTDVAKKHWANSPHGSKIELKLGPAQETLPQLDGPFDLVFLDANKDGYIDYWEAAVPRLADRGLIVADNVLAGGKVLDPDADVAVAKFNAHVQADDRMDSLMLPVRDGVTVAWRRS